MEKRIQKRRSLRLPYRNYLWHFKWPLIGIFCFIIIICLSKIHFISRRFPLSEFYTDIESPFHDVIYPIDVSSLQNVNTSILYYFSKKEDLKTLDDARSIHQQEKVILPMINNKLASESYLILEFTQVFGHPRFCSHSSEEIFGKMCPYKNW